VTTGVPEETAQTNLDFLKRYANIDMKPRTGGSVRVDKSLVHSGDGIYIIRLDGLDPVLAFAMGSTTGHVTTALWIDGELYVVESTVKDSYWPVDGIQKTPWDVWLQQVSLLCERCVCVCCWRDSVVTTTAIPPRSYSPNRRTMRTFRWCGRHFRPRTVPNSTKPQLWQSFTRWRAWNTDTRWFM
jgi:hypothetical protein